jgi:hypothetical protein
MHIGIAEFEAVKQLADMNKKCTMYELFKSSEGRY